MLKSDKYVLIQVFKERRGRKGMVKYIYIITGSLNIIKIFIS